MADHIIYQRTTRYIKNPRQESHEVNVKDPTLSGPDPETAFVICVVQILTWKGWLRN